MQYEVETVEGYLEAIPDKSKEAVMKLRKTIKDHLPEGFSETLAYGMIGYVVPLTLYPSGYHVKKGEPLPFISIAAQKNHIALYHMGLYSNPEVEKWFVEAYAKRVPTKLDMGKSCIRFKNPNKIPYDLIGELCEKISVESHIESYEKRISK